MEAKKGISRRDFMKVAISTIGGFIGLGLGVPAVSYIISPAVKKENVENWIRLGLITKVEIGSPTLFKAKVKRQTGWVVNEEELAVYVLTENGRDYIAMSNICTHLGCRIRWITEQGKFFCPCHNGVFDKEGNVIDGPPPRPLDRYEVKVEDDQLFILGV